MGSASLGAPSSVHVLIVEDAPEFQQILTTVLEREQYQTTIASDGETALEIAAETSPDIVLLDLGLPGIDGTEVCRRLRQFSDAYVIMLTAREDEVDRLVGLAIGADDYMTKPFSARELVARIQAMLRRPRTGAVPSNPDFETRNIGDLELNLLAREVSIDGQLIDLTRIEFDLLSTLSGRPEMVFTRRMLLDQVWGDGWIGSDHVVDVHIANLRRKIDIDDRKHVKTVRGVGYRFAPEH